MKTLDNSTIASHPGDFKLSSKKLEILQPELKTAFAWWYFHLSTNNEVYPRRKYWLTYIEEHLLYGDTQPAVIISTSPLLVAAYSDELDCVAMLHFDESLVKDHELRIGSRLLTVNTYFTLEESYERDLRPGPNALGRWGNFTPYIADFLSDDEDGIERQKARISEASWKMVEELGATYLTDVGWFARDGRPLFCSYPGSAVRRKANEDVASISYFEVFKRVLLLLAFLVFYVLSLVAFRRGPTGWLAIAVFGSFSVLAAVNVFQIRKLKIVEDKGALKNFRRSLIWLGTMAIALLVGLGGEWISDFVAFAWPELKIWLACFVSTLAFYPLRDKQEYGAFSFPVWLVYSVFAGFISIGVWYLF